MITKQVSTKKVARLASHHKAEVYIKLNNSQSVHGTDVFSYTNLTYIVFFESHVYTLAQGVKCKYGIRYNKDEYLANTKYYGKKLQSFFYEGGIHKSNILEVQTKVVLSNKY